ncbi:hypothetical protein RIF25_13775 [Thermosynechococcaceae cyanobacterium BACA0444]|uniref:Uncharacterized protein n=1 Tax=Pseudocalidococcus azoricus BACA0444 TaxID=2918990 RepID=A0AAE4FTH2_9CYAN|nr:hypothetical protein [Pseudocalidococcus azoricus]MDS3861871.1 hypothetical protein [Pseudocalidococcus azoricus BACA0444]
MITTVPKPSAFIHEIQLETLLEKKKADQLTLDEVFELEAIGELDRICTHMNAMLAN